MPEAHTISQHDAPAVAPALSDEQFAELKRLLTPGYELSTLMLADYRRQEAELAAEAERERQEAEKAAPPPAASLDATG